MFDPAMAAKQRTSEYREEDWGVTGTVIHFLMFFGPLFAVIIAVGQMVRTRKDRTDFIFASSFFGMGIWMFQISLYSSGVMDSWPYVYHLVTWIVPFNFLVPPLMGLRYRLIISREYQAGARHLLLFAPAAASLIVLLLPVFLPGLPDPLEYYPGLPVLGNRFGQLPLYCKIVFSMYFLPNLYLIVYMAPVLIRMSVVWKQWRHNRYPGAARAGYIFAAIIVLSNVICFAGNLFSFGVIKLSILVANTATVFVFLVTQRKPDYLRLLQSETRRAHYEKTRLRGLDVDSIITRLYEIMEDEKAFADEELSLKDVAAELSVSLHQLSEVLNERVKKNFKTFVNEFRVEEAKKLLVEEPERSVLSIGVAVGFNSNTTFCTVFAKMAGCAPGQYRKNFRAQF